MGRIISFENYIKARTSTQDQMYSESSHSAAKTEVLGMGKVDDILQYKANAVERARDNIANGCSTRKDIEVLQNDLRDSRLLLKELEENSDYWENIFGGSNGNIISM